MYSLLKSIFNLAFGFLSYSINNKSYKLIVNVIKGQNICILQYKQISFLL